MDHPPQPPTDVPVRPAATVMLLRDVSTGSHSGGLEVFMLRRTHHAAFAGGMYVFPGGRVDDSDGEGDAAFAMAAVRECFEESGVLLAVDADGRRVRDGHPVLGHRHGVHRGEVDVRALAAEHGLTLGVDDLVWTSHWITPKGESARRFDTRFFMVACPEGQTSEHDDSETVASMWVEPASALDRWRVGELQLMPPTVANLEFLAAHASVASAIEAARNVGTPPCILPKVRMVDGRMVGVSLPGDVDYDRLD